MTRSREWLVPLTGVGFVLLGIVSFIVGGEPKSADDPVREIVDYYVDNKDSIQASAFLGVAATLLLVFFGAYLRRVLRAAAPEREILSLVSVLGLVVIAVAFAIDTTILIALSEAADDIDPVAVQSLQALWDNDFVPLVLGVLMFLWATGLAVIRTGALAQVARLGDGGTRSPRPHADRLRRGDRRCHPGPRTQHRPVGTGPLRARNRLTQG